MRDEDCLLLERAAKAAGLTLAFWPHGVYAERDGAPVFPWNPLERDGDALRLAVALEMDVFVRGGRWSEAVCPGGQAIKEPHGADPLAATRRAIVRAAAAVAQR